MKHTRTNEVFPVLVGALLTGLLWRVRGTGGWGAAWGLLTVGLVLTLFLAGAVQKEQGPSFRLIALAALSFMLTAPAWGTLLTGVTGVIPAATVGEGAEDVFISPAAALSAMALMGFGIPAVFGVLLGRCFSEKEWKLKDYILVLAVFLVVLYGAKASIAHPLVRLLEPQAYEAFQTGIARGEWGKGVYSVYLEHFNAESWAKKVPGGRHYYALVSAVAGALGSAAAILAARFIAKDQYAARTGALCCGAFAAAITLADVFFYFGSGGYHMAQGLSLPESFAAWSLWEYFTGFLAGGAITAYILKTAPREKTKETLLQNAPPKLTAAVTFLLCCVGAVGVNIVRPVLRRFADSRLLVPAVIIAAVSALAAGIFLCLKAGWRLEKATNRLYPVLCLCLTAYTVLCYLFIAPAEKQEFRNLSAVHNLLVLLSFAAAVVFLAVAIGRNRTEEF